MKQAMILGDDDDLLVCMIGISLTSLEDLTRRSLTMVLMLFAMSTIWNYSIPVVG